MVIGVVVSVTAFLAARTLFARIVAEPSLAEAYSLLVGIAACVIAGVICGKLFRPKRRIAEQASEGDAVGDVIAELRAESQGLGSVVDLPAATVQELKDLDLYGRFRDAEQQPQEVRS